MDFKFSPTGLSGTSRRLQRFFEMLPGITSWSVILGMTVLGVMCPPIAAVIIIAFYIYWLMRLLYMTTFLILSYFRLNIEKNTDWMERARGMDDLPAYIGELWEKRRTFPQGTSFSDRLSLYLHAKHMMEISDEIKDRPASSDICHLVIIPVVKEERDVIEPGIKSFLAGSFPPERILVVFALEERADEKVKKGVLEIAKAFSGKFMDILTVVHPDGKEGEARVKGANTTFAAGKAAKYLSEKGIPYGNVISSCFDSDTVINPDYFASLTYYFLSCPKRDRASFQPVPVYNNNIWEAPGITRVLETGSSFFQLIEATNPEKLVTFSSHSMSFKALVDAGYWPVDMISDDSAIYWKSFIRFDGDYRVVPMYTTLSMDAVVADNWWHTVRNVYKQRRRWAWGVENFPIVMRAFMKDRKISFFRKFKIAFKLFEGHIAWTTWAFLLTFIGWLPAIFAGKEFSNSVFYYSAPRITGTVFNLASVSLITSIVLSLLLLPQKKEKHRILKRIGFAFQWLLVPLTLVFLSAIPALDAQTRMMLGRSMTFWVTDKKTPGGRR